MASTYYDYIAASYDKLYKEEQLKKLFLVKEKLSISQTSKLLDIGCGTGISFDLFDCQLYGIDPSRALLDRIKPDKVKQHNIKLASAESIPFPDKFFDIIISVTAIQNFSDIEKALKEIKRVAKQNAQIIISCLKRSKKLNYIKHQVKKYFNIQEETDETKDCIWVLSCT